LKRSCRRPSPFEYMVYDHMFTSTAFHETDFRGFHDGFPDVKISIITIIVSIREKYIMRSLFQCD
jgi:hypothetical protein